MLMEKAMSIVSQPPFCHWWQGFRPRGTSVVATVKQESVVGSMVATTLRALRIPIDWMPTKSAKAAASGTNAIGPLRIAKRRASAKKSRGRAWWLSFGIPLSFLCTTGSAFAPLPLCNNPRSTTQIRKFATDKGNELSPMDEQFVPSPMDGDPTPSLPDGDLSCEQGSDEEDDKVRDSYNGIDEFSDQKNLDQVAGGGEKDEEGIREDDLDVNEATTGLKKATLEGHVEFIERILVSPYEGIGSVWEALQRCSPEVQAQKDVVLVAVRVNGNALEHASDELKGDKDIVLSAVQQNGWALEHASDELKADKEIVLAAVKQSGSALEDASDELKGDKEIVLVAVKQNSMALEHASDELKADREFVLSAVQQSGSALKYASDELKGDKEIVLSAVQQDGSALKDASCELKADKETVLAAVKQCGWALHHASRGLKADRDVVLAAVTLRGYLLYLASPELKADKEVVLAAVKQSRYAMEHASDELKADKEIVLAAGYE